MTVREFNALNENEQAELVWAGIFLEDRQDARYNILLYSVQDFYVEVFYSNKINEVVRFKAFKSTDNLVPYLNYVSIKNL